MINSVKRILDKNQSEGPLKNNLNSLNRDIDNFGILDRAYVSDEGVEIRNKDDSVLCVILPSQWAATEPRTCMKGNKRIYYIIVLKQKKTTMFLFFLGSVKKCGAEMWELHAERSDRHLIQVSVRAVQSRDDTMKNGHSITTCRILDSEF